MFTALCHLITGFQSATWQFDNEVVTISAGAGFQSGPQTWAAHATDGVSLPLSVLLHVTAPFDNTAQVIFRCRACYKRLAARDRCIQGENWWTRRRSSRSMARQSQQAQIQILNQLHCNHRAAIVEQRKVFTIDFFFFKKKKNDGASAGRATLGGSLAASFCRRAWQRRIGTKPARTNRSVSFFFFLMKHEPGNGKVLGSSTFGLCDDVRAVESRRAELWGVNKILCWVSTELEAE